MYFGGSIVITAASAAAALRSPQFMNFVSRNSFGVRCYITYGFLNAYKNLNLTLFNLELK